MKNNTIVNFNLKPLSEKALLIAEHGQYVESIEYMEYWIHLYSIHHDFIEVYYCINTRQIELIAVANEQDLNKFLNKISLPL